MKNLYFIVLFLLSSIFSIQLHQLVDAYSIVKYLPGFEGPLPFHLETGYVSVGEYEDVELFYYFIKSERNPEIDPIVIWLTGGPGCSSICGLLFENGPLLLKGDEYNGTVPPLKLTSFSWTKVANMLYLDSPAGSGFSFATNPAASESSDTKQILQIDQFLRSWFVDHPEFNSNPLYIGGDSYSGKIIPGIVQQISLGNEKGLTPLINIQGYVLGNPVIDMNMEPNNQISFAHRLGLISDELFQSIERNCGGKYLNNEPSSEKCSNDLQTFHKCIKEIYDQQILLPNCQGDRDVDQSENLIKELLGDDSSPLPSPSCFTYTHFLSDFWANDENVRKALGIKKDFGIWKRCNTKNIPYTYDIDNAFPYHVNNSLKGFRSLIYSGDHDMEVPYFSTQAWIKALNYSIVDDWRPWMISSIQVAGYTTTYANKMTFATIKGGGHTAEYNPDQCSVLFKRWIDGEPL